MHKKLLLCFIILVSLPLSALFAQKIDSVLSVYNEHFQQEKIHLHFDKSVYNKGETIWFKAYLMTGSVVSDLSKNFYADWYDASGKLIAHNVFPVFGASAKGQFDIPENYSYASLHLRAYTRWMLNFDTSFLFDKDIAVSQRQLQKTSSVVPVTEIHFFPEGGDMVDGLDARIAFLATDQNGHPVSIKGIITNHTNEFIDSLTTEHDGMGSLRINKAVAGESYFVNWVNEYGKTGVTGLPAVKRSGAVLRSQTIHDKIRIGIERSADRTGNLQIMYLLAHMNQQVLSESKINLTDKAAALIEMNIKDFPTGVLQLTLFNALWQPVAERIVFVNNHQYQFDAAINTIAKGTDKREKNIIEIDVPDSVFANLSVSVTDAGLSRVNDNTIISQFLLSDEIKGRITDPAFYFSNDDDSTRRFLDLVMLTHGWRRFNWDDVVQARLPRINYQRDSDYIEIAGSVSGKAFKTSDKDFITLFLSGKNARKQIIPVPVQENGRFSKSGLLFFDTVKVYHSFKQKNLSDKVDVDYRTNIFSAQNPFIKVFNRPPYLLADPSGYTREVFFTEEQKRLQKLISTTTLKNVTVYSNIKSKSNLDILDDKYTMGAFAGEARFRGDIIGDEMAQDYSDIFKYLESRLPGFYVTQGQLQDGPPDRSHFYNITYRNSDSLGVYLNEMQSSADELATIPMSEIVYVKIFTSGFVGAWRNGKGESPVIAVYTRKGGEELAKYALHDNGQRLTGYTSYKEFFSPVYSDSTRNFAPDVRTTLYWNPYIITNAKNHKVQFEFYNNDISKKLRIVLEGMNANGKLTRVEKEIE